MWKLFFTVMCGICFCGCEPVGPYKIQIVAALDEGMTAFGLKIVEANSLVNPRQLKGDSFVFATGLDISRDEYVEIFAKSKSFQEARLLFFSHIVPKDIKLDLAFSGEHFAALDFDSLYLLTAYKLYEDVEKFYRDLVKPSSRVSDAPVTIGVYSAFTTSGPIPIPSAFFDNSAYLPLIDIFKIYRVADQSGLPFGMNPGVIAHEYHHRIFQKMVFESHGELGFQVWKRLNSPHESLKNTRAQMLIKAIDEGLSDLFGVGFSGNPQFLEMSFAEDSGEAKKIRDLNGEFAIRATYDNLANSTILKKFRLLCGSESLDFSNPNFRYYCLGTVIARTIWEASEYNLENLRIQILPQMENALFDFGRKLAMDLEGFDLHWFWDSLLEELDIPQAHVLCQKIEHRFSGIFKRINRCESL